MCFGMVEPVLESLGNASNPRSPTRPARLGKPTSTSRLDRRPLSCQSVFEGSDSPLLRRLPLAQGKRAAFPPGFPSSDRCRSLTTPGAIRSPYPDESYGHAFSIDRPDCFANYTPKSGVFGELSGLLKLFISPVC